MFFISLLIAAAVAFADQLIKLAVVSNIDMYEVKDFIPHVLSLTQIRNSGAAWSIMEGQTWFLILLPIVIIAVSLVFMFLNRKGSVFSLVSLSLVMGGGIGNLIDRIRLGEVVDYLKLELFDFPIFNLADMCVVVGAILFCGYMVFFDESKKEDTKQEAYEKPTADDSTTEGEE